MKNLYLCCCLLLSSLLTNACTQQCSSISNYQKHGVVIGNKKYVTEEIHVGSFNEICLTGSPDVVFTPRKGEPAVKVYTSENIVELLDIHTSNNTLYIGFKKNVNVTYDKLIIHISAETLEKASVSGSGEIQINDVLKTENLSFAVTGSGGIRCKKVDCHQLYATVNGSGDIIVNNLTTAVTQAQVTGAGDIHLDGSTQKAIYKVTGSGNIIADGLKAHKATAKITGSGDIKCHACHSLQTHIIGSGDVGYKGQPQIEQKGQGLYKL